MAAVTFPPAMQWLTGHMDSLGKRYTLSADGLHLAGQCPAHDDRNPSFTADWTAPEPPEKAGRVEVDCKSGCSRDVLRDALGGSWRNLMDGRSELGHSPNGTKRPARRRTPSLASVTPPPPRRAGSSANGAAGEHSCRFDYRHPEAQHVYTDAAGTVIARVDRVRCTDPACPDLAEHGKANKTFVTRHPDGRRGKPPELDAVLYRLPEVLAAIEADRPVYVCEGEGDADALAAAGECGTSAFGGAGRQWRPGYTRRLMGANVVIVADNDAAGYRRAAAVAEALGNVPASIRIVRAADDRSGADVSDHLAAGLTVAELLDAAAEVAASTGPAPVQHSAREVTSADSPPGPVDRSPAESAPGPSPASTTAADDAPGITAAEAPPRYRLPASAGAWAYATGEDRDGRERGVYRRADDEWQWVEFLPYIYERVAHRDGAGRRARMSYRLGTRLDAPADERAVVGHLAVKTGEWAEPLGVPLAADPKVIQAVASAIYREAERTAPMVEACPRWTPAGTLDMPPADVGPAGYGETAGTEADARQAWAEIAAIMARHPKTSLTAGASLAAPYVAALRRQSFIVHLAGRDRRGKTTAHQVAAALYGDPEVIIRPWDASAIGLTSLAGEYGCLPPIFDELGARNRPKSELQPIVFQLAQGARRTKGARLGGSTVTAPWRGIVLSTGNMSLLAALTERGAIARVIEVPTPILGTRDDVDDPAAAADAGRLDDLTAAAYGWPFAWSRAAEVTPEAFGVLLAAAVTDLACPPGGTLGTLARHLAAAVAGAALLDKALGTGTLRPAALAAAAALLDDLTDRLAEIAATPAERVAAAVAHAVVTRPEAFPALGDLRDPQAGRRYRDGEGFTITEPPADFTHPPARWDPPPGLAVGDIGVWCADLPDITAAAGLDDAVTALRELRQAGRLIPAGDGAHMRYTVRVLGQKVHAYVFRLPADDDTPPADPEPYARPMGDSVGTVGTDHLADRLPAEMASESVPTPVGTDHLGGDSAPAAPPPAETSGRAGAAAPGPAANPQVSPVPTTAPEPSAPVGTGGDSTAERFPLGPVLVVDADVCYLDDGAEVAAVDTLSDMVELAAGLGLGAPRLHRWGRDSDPHIYLTPAACTRYGIPAEPGEDDRRALALPTDHPAAVALRAAGWNVQALRTTFQVWRPGPDRPSVSVTLLGWVPHVDPAGFGALLAGDPSPASLAARLGRLAALTLPPAYSAGVTSERLMRALRPDSRRRRDPVTGDVIRESLPGSLTAPVPPSIYDAPDAHPAARDRDPALACREEAMTWGRPLDGWTDAERAAPWAVTLDVNAAFLAAASDLPVGLSAPRPLTPAEVEAFNADPAAQLRRRAGVYVAEVTGLAEVLDPRLPCPLTETGQWPDRPLPLHAATLRYAIELGGRVTVSAGAVSDECGPYLTPWQRRIRAAYLAVLAEAGIIPEMDPAAYLAAYAVMPERHPDAAAVLAAIKALYKAGIGRMRQSPGVRPEVVERATWRPDIRAEVIAAARCDLHRKMVRVAALTGAAPLAVNADAITYAAPDDSALSVIPWTLDGGQVPGAIRLGPRPGWFKFSHASPMPEVIAHVQAGGNPAVKWEPDPDAQTGE